MTTNQNYEYVIDLDERGEFLADVRNQNGATVYEIDTDGIASLIEDGYMKHNADTKGLLEYLQDIGTLPTNATLS